MRNNRKCLIYIVKSKKDIIKAKQVCSKYLFKIQSIVFQNPEKTKKLFAKKGKK